MIDDQIIRKIVMGEIVRLEATTTEDAALSMKDWLQQFGKTISVNIYPQQHSIRMTLWIGGLQHHQRFVIVTSLKSSSLSFKLIVNNSS